MWSQPSVMQNNPTKQKNLSVMKKQLPHISQVKKIVAWASNIVHSPGVDFYVVIWDK